MKLNLKEIQQINLFEKISRAKVKDCLIEENEITFIVEEGNVKKALGENNKNLKKISEMLKKPVHIIAFSKVPEKFIGNLIYPIKAKIKLEDDVVHITPKDYKTKGKIYGRERENLKKIRSLTQKYFKIKDVVVE